MARQIITTFALAALLAWSLLGLGTWGLVSLGNDVLRLILNLLFWGSPDASSTADALGQVLRGFGGWVVALAWLSGSLVIVLGAAALQRVSLIEARTTRFGAAARPEREMRDVTPRHPPQRSRLRAPDSPDDRA